MFDILPSGEVFQIWPHCNDTSNPTRSHPITNTLSHKKSGFEFIIKPENTCENPGRRKVAKLCLHALWGQSWSKR